MELAENNFQCVHNAAKLSRSSLVSINTILVSHSGTHVLCSKENSWYFYDLENVGFFKYGEQLLMLLLSCYATVEKL